MNLRLLFKQSQMKRVKRFVQTNKSKYDILSESCDKGLY